VRRGGDPDPADQGNVNSKEVKKLVEDFALEADPAAKWGDRRQEIVFIGIGMKERKIEELMDTCLLTDEEMLLYQSQVSVCACVRVRACVCASGSRSLSLSCSLARSPPRCLDVSMLPTR
jgi:hypothetical protein